MSFPRLLSFVCVLIVVGGASSEAQTIIWANAGSGDFGTSTNWTPTGVPGSTNTVQFAAATPAFQPNLAASYTVTGVQFAGGSGPFTLSATLCLLSTGCGRKGDPIPHPLAAPAPCRIP